MNSSSNLYFHRYRKKLAEILAFICSALIMGLRPILGPALCKFEPSCTRFAIEALKTLPFFKAVWVIAKRLLSCNPFWP
jgi:hypothetical protein